MATVFVQPVPACRQDIASPCDGDRIPLETDAAARTAAAMPGRDMSVFATRRDLAGPGQFCRADMVSGDENDSAGQADYPYL